MIDLKSKEFRNLYFTFVSFIALMVVSTFGYWFIAKGNPSLIDCLYMTTITVATIGYAEVIDISAPSGRIFTIFVASTGIGLLGYLLTQTSAYIIEGNLKMSLINQKVERMIKKLDNHYIVCGYGRVGQAIINDLISQNLNLYLSILAIKPSKSLAPKVTTCFKAMRPKTKF